MHDEDRLLEEMLALAERLAEYDDALMAGQYALLRARIAALIELRSFGRDLVARPAWRALRSTGRLRWLPAAVGGLVRRVRSRWPNAALTWRSLRATARSSKLRQPTSRKRAAAR